MSYIPAGTPANTTLIFNSGFLDFGNNRILNIDNLKIDYKTTEVSFMVLNSIKKVAHAKSALTVTITGKSRSLTSALEAMFFGASSSDATTTIYSVLDGQIASQLNPVITVYDSAGVEHQYQAINALLTSNSFTTTNEGYAEWDFTLDCIDLNLIQPLNG